MCESGLRTQSTTNSPEDIFFVPEIQYLFKRFV